MQHALFFFNLKKNFKKMLISSNFFFRHPDDAIYIRQVSDAETKPK